MRAFKIGILIASALLVIGVVNFTPSSGQELSSVNNCAPQSTHEINTSKTLFTRT
jgi:hypothetical protein